MREEIKEFLKQQGGWVSDGTYTKLQPTIANQADLVLFLDIPLWERQLGYLKRVSIKEHRHPEIHFWQNLYFTHNMIRRTCEYETGFREFISQYNSKLVVLKSYKEIDSWLDTLD